MGDEKECMDGDGWTILKRIRESEIPSEKIFLVSEEDNQNEYFTASLGPNFQEGKKDQFVLEGTDSKTVEAIVDFCYSGCIDLTVDNVAKFLAIASSVDIDLLVKKCRKFYIENLSKSNCIDALIDADRYSFSDLRQLASDLIRESFDMVPTTEIHKLDHSLLLDLLKSDKIQTPADLVFSRLFEWFQNRKDEREKHMPDLLMLIRLNRIKLESNSTSVLMIADEYNFADLRQRALDIVCSRFEKLPATEIHGLNYRVFRDLLKSDQIRAPEDLVFKRLLEWFQIEEDERRQYMPELLRTIRLNHITPEFLNETIHDVFESFECFTLVIAEYKSRASGRRSNVDFRRFRPILRLFLQNTDETPANKINIEKYNNVLNCFEEGAEMTFGQRICFNVVLHQNRLFVLGGDDYAGDGGYLNCVNEHLILIVSTYDLDSSEEIVLPSMIIPREDAITLSNGNSIYMFGGWNGKRIDSCECFNTETKEWKEIKSMNVARYWGSAAVLNGYIYVAGGNDADESIGAVELYDPKSDEWTDISPMKNARENFALIELNGFLYAMGGNVRITEKYDPWKNRWTEIKSFDGSKDISNGIKVDGQIFVIMRNGRFGEVRIDGSDNCTFIPLAKSKYESDDLCSHLICRN